MKSKHKALLLLLCAVLLVAATAVGTFAYLTDTEAVTNTFTVGKVTLGDGTLEKGLDEALVNEYGQPIDSEENQNVVEKIEDAPRVQTHDYKLIPGYTYTKDPTVHVKNDSENSYIFVKVENGISDIEAATDKGNIAAQIIENGWTKLDDVENVYYQEWTKPTDTTGTTDLVVFEKFQIDGDKTVNVAEGETTPAGKFNIADYLDDEIVITAYAIQAAGFNTAREAWTAGGFA